MAGSTGQDETRIRLPIRVSSSTRVQSITNSEFGVQYFGSIQFRRRGVEHLDGVFRPEFFSRSRSGVIIGMDMLDVIQTSVERPNDEMIRSGVWV